MLNDQPWFAVRVSVVFDDGSSVNRDYVRGQQRVGKDRFVAFALGDLITLTSSKLDREGILRGDHTIDSWAITEIDFETVRQNRKYRHTTHAE